MKLPTESSSSQGPLSPFTTNQICSLTYVLKSSVLYAYIPHYFFKHSITRSLTSINHESPSLSQACTSPHHTRGCPTAAGQVQLGKAPGPDGIPAKVLKLCAMELSLILYSIFWESYRTASIPTQPRNPTLQNPTTNLQSHSLK